MVSAEQSVTRAPEAQRGTDSERVLAEINSFCPVQAVFAACNTIMVRVTPTVRKKAPYTKFHTVIERTAQYDAFIQTSAATHPEPIFGE